MSDVSKTNEFEEANKISKQIDCLKNEILAIKIKGGERGLRMKASHVQRIEDLNKKIKQLTFRRNLLVRTVQRIPNSSPQLVQAKVHRTRSQHSNSCLEKQIDIESEMKRALILDDRYGHYPKIEDVITEDALELNDAETFTKSILEDLPSGNVSDRVTACHILNKLLQRKNIECLFFKTDHHKGLYDAFRHLSDLDSVNNSFTLELKSYDGLSGSIKPECDRDILKFIRILTKSIENKQTHPTLDDIINRLSKVHRVDKKNITLQTIYAGKFHIVYTLENLVKLTGVMLKEIKTELKNQFQEYLTIKMHPFLFRPSFDISLFRESNNSTLSNDPDEYQIGPPGRARKYVDPGGWTKYRFNVSGKYNDGDAWLHPIGDPRNWYRAFYVIGSQNVDGNGDSCINFQDRSTISNNSTKTFITNHDSSGVIRPDYSIYCSPDSKYFENSNDSIIAIDTKEGKKFFKCLIQIAVNPDGIYFESERNLWIVYRSQDIRPFGLLIKATDILVKKQDEVTYSSSMESIENLTEN